MLSADLRCIIDGATRVDRLSSPMQRRDDIGAKYGIALYLKREDRLDDIGAGHKWRRLSFLRGAIADAGAQTLITAGSQPSGQCVGVAGLARQLGIESRLIYLGDAQNRPTHVSGNYLLASLLSTHIEWHERTPWAMVTELLALAAEREREFGRVPFVVRPGVDAWPAPLASVELGLEIAEQCGSIEARTHVIAVAGTGTTCAGLATAFHLLRLNFRVHGACIGTHSIAKLLGIEPLLGRYMDFFGNVVNFGDIAPRFYEPLRAGAYGAPSPREIDIIARNLTEHLLPTDPNYMVKVFALLEDLLSNGEIVSGDRVVLLVSGGTNDFLSGTPAALAGLVPANRI